MKKIISYLLIGSTLFASTVFAAAGNCGDGNHFYHVLDQGETVFYAGDSKVGTTETANQENTDQSNTRVVEADTRATFGMGSATCWIWAVCVF